MTSRTNSVADSIHIWLDNAGKVELLDRSETILLGRQVQAWQNGTLDEKAGMKALNKIIRHNLRLVASVWKKQFGYVRPGEPRAADLLQEGCFGLRSAALKWDPERGYTFATYAVAWIRKDMGHYLRDRDRTIRLSADCYGVVNTTNKYIDEVVAATGKAPTLEAIAEKCKKKPAAVKRFLDAYAICNARTSLDQQVSTNHKGAEGESVIGDFIEAKAEYDLEFDKRSEKLLKVIEVIMSAAGLSDGEKILVRERSLYTTEPRSYASIAKEIGMKDAQARPVYLRALARMEQAAASSGMTMTGILCRA